MTLTHRNAVKIPVGLDAAAAATAWSEAVLRAATERSAANKDRLNGIARFQIAIILHALRFPALEKLVYSTCSVNMEENEDVVAKVLSSHRLGGQWKLAPAMAKWHRRGIASESGLDAANAALCARTCPEQDNTMGFFVACFVRDKNVPRTPVTTPSVAERGTQKWQQADGGHTGSSRQNYDGKYERYGTSDGGGDGGGYGGGGYGGGGFGGGGGGRGGGRHGGGGAYERDERTTTKRAREQWEAKNETSQWQKRGRSEYAPHTAQDAPSSTMSTTGTTESAATTSASVKRVLVPFRRNDKTTGKSSKSSRK